MPDQATVQDSLIGLEFGHYRILERIGSGGMGVVYRGNDTHLDREVAIKVLNPGIISDELSRKRFRNEAHTLSKLNHPNVATVHDFETQGECDFLVMEYIHGVNLTDRLALGPISEEEVFRLGVQLCDGLAAAHALGVVHRDLKPGNLRLTTDGRLKILDFGLAKLRKPLQQERESATTLGSEAFVGTLPYMAPEQLTGEEVDIRTDIYAVGLVLYEMATGQRPYAELCSGKLFGAILHHAPIRPRLLNPRVSREFERMVEKCLEKAPENRYQSVQKLGHDLQRFGPAARETSTVTGAVEAFFQWVGQRKRWMTLGISLTALMGIGIGARTFFPASVSLWLGAPTVPHVKQLAVLPFTTTDGDAEAAAFSAGLTETLTAKLTQLTRDPQLQVVPASDMQAKRIGTVEGARLEFGVNLVLEGSLHKSGNLVRINCILVDTQTRRQIRADSLTVPVGDAFRAEDVVVNGAIEMLGLDAHLKQHGDVAGYGTQVAGAYDYYLQGRGYLQNYDREENVDSAIQVFERALTLDKNYALAYAGLGEAYWEKYQIDKQREWLNKSRDSCDKANLMDAQLPEAHTCLGTLLAGTGNYAEAAAEFSKVLQEEPTNDAAYKGLANAYERLGKLQEAESTFKQAIAVRPHYWATYNWLGAFYYDQARPHEASEKFRQVTLLAPDNALGFYNLAASSIDEARYYDAITAAERSIAIQPSAHGYTNLGAAYFFLKRYDEAIHAFEDAFRYSKNDPLIWWNLGDGYFWTPARRADSAAAYQKCADLATEELKINPKNSLTYRELAICQAMLGQKASAIRMLKQGFRLAPEDPFLMFQAALIYNQFEDRDETLLWLAKCRDTGFSQVKIRDYPNFEPLHSDTRFQVLVRAK